ncbi:MAG: triphosphoribosyl-dephospho-CoA synthase [Gemmatimonadota bacterium]
MIVEVPEVAQAAQLACLLEASAPKPGNVSPGRPFRNITFEDFLASAVAIGPAFTQVGERSLGETIRAAVEATARVTRTNTNLGIILLLAPLARAAVESGGSPLERLERVLSATTVQDAEEVYQAIRRANPGGMGVAVSQDLGSTPQVTLLETMELAAGRDAVAGEYATVFATTRTVGAPALRTARADGLNWSDAVVETFLKLLASRPDTLIERKLGKEAAAEVSAKAAAIIGVGGVRSDEGRQAIERFDGELRDPQNSRNPGTTADLTTAAIFTELLEFGWPSKGGIFRAQ